MFENPDFEIDEDCEEYRLLNPVISQKVAAKRKREESSDEEDNQVLLYLKVRKVLIKQQITL